MNAQRVAVVQASPAFFDLKSGIEKVRKYTAEAKKDGAALVLFPEAYLPGYPWGLGFGTVVGSRSDAGRDVWLNYWENSVAYGDEAFLAISKIAKDYSVYLVIGVIERSKLGGTLFCTLLYFDPDGHCVGRHRKIKPTAAERVIWGEGAGDDLAVLDTSVGKLGGLICWENYMPLARMALYQQGIQVYLAPTADQRDNWQATVRHIALEGRCFVLSCNQFVTKSMYPAHLRPEIEDKPATMSRGGSVIISPLGKVLAGPLFDQAGILYADLDLREVVRGKMDFDVEGHYARKDLFHFQYLKSR